MADARKTLVDDADGYEHAVNGVVVRTSRTGVGEGPNLVTTGALPGVLLTEVRAGFPMLTRGECLPDRVYAAVLVAAPPGTRWCDTDLSSGDVVLYGPGAHHTAVNPTGTHFAFAAMEIERVAQTADEMRVDFSPLGDGETRVLPPRQAGSLPGTLPGLLDDSSPVRETASRKLAIELIETLAASAPRDACRGFDNGALVSKCLDYAERKQRVPSIEELTSATFVCRRKLWDAFDERFRMAPGRFFRGWGLAKAYERLRNSDPSETSVSAVAADLGFTHTGRFAGEYRRAFGELPSQTLKESG